MSLTELILSHARTSLTIALRNFNGSPKMRDLSRNSIQLAIHELDRAIAEVRRNNPGTTDASQ